MTEQALTELENKEEKNNKSAFLKVKERFSIRSKSKNKKSTDTPDTAENNKDSNGKNPEKETEDGKETAKEKIAEPELSDDGKKEKKMSTLERVKMRLSTRKKSSKKSESEDKTEEEIVISSKVETENSDDEKKEAEEKTKEEKSKNLLQRILRFFRSKKNRDNVEKQDKETEKNDLDQDIDGNSDDEEDNEIIAICGKSDDEEKEAERTVVIPIITTNKPPLPGPAGRRLPSSATTSHTRPMSQLDEALKQFRLSTAASRENLRNSRQNLSQMEEQVKVQLRSRPATPVIGLRAHQPDNKLSSSLSDLRQ